MNKYYLITHSYYSHIRTCVKVNKYLCVHPENTRQSSRLHGCIKVSAHGIKSKNLTSKLLKISKFRCFKTPGTDYLLMQCHVQERIWSLC